MLEEDLKEPTRREWTSFWSLVTLQILQSFNVNVAKFVLVALAAWLILQKQTFRGVEHIIVICLVVPYVLFAPTAGWLSDRFAKSAVIRWTSWMQLGALGLLAASLHFQHLALAIASFFIIALQAALLSPSKIGVVKEFVGARRLGFASGVMEGTVILAILGGQIVGGTWFDSGIKDGGLGWTAAAVPIWTALGLCLASIGLAYVVQNSQSLSKRPFSFAEAISHMRDLGEFRKDRALLGCGLGVAFFWGFGGFINLVVLEIAEDLFHGGAGTGGAFAHLWAMPGLGIILGSITASLISRKNIEMGLAPFGAVVMAISTAVLAVAPPQSAIMLVMLVVAGASAAVFLVPLQAMIQHMPTDEKRGAVISASNLLNSLAGIVAVVIQLVLKLAGVSVGIQFVLLTLISLVIAWISFRHLGTDFIRLIGLTIVRTIYRIRTTGESVIPKEGGVLLLPNHVTWADSFFISAACPRRVRFVMDVAFMRNRWVGTFCKIFQTVPIDRTNPREAIRITAEALQTGDVLCLFPEGQLTRTGTLSELQRGFELIARMSKCPLVPVWMDGSWGSIFSFERGRFFRKKPYGVPYTLTVAFGPALEPRSTGTEELREGLFEASAAALEARFSDPAWARRQPITAVATDLRRAWINGHQIGQVHALPRKRPFARLASDPLPASLPGLASTFPELFGSPMEALPTVSPGHPHWVGGSTLRDQISATNGSEFVFFDFSAEALSPLERPGVTHCPCLAVEGVVVSMSMPDPPPPYHTSEPQKGRKANSWGKLLPGFFLRADADGQLRVHGPAAPEAGLPLPAGASLDIEGFLVAPSA